LSNARQLEILEPSGTAVTDAGIAVLGASSSMKLDSLALDRTALTDASVVSLSKMKSLTSLSLVGTAMTERVLKNCNRLYPRRILILILRLNPCQISAELELAD